VTPDDLHPDTAVPHDGDRVEVRVPADPFYVATVRLSAASLAVRCDLTIDDIEDLRLAVDEACALLLPRAGAGTTLDAVFTLARGHLAVSASVAAQDGVDIDRSGFAWTVLSALVSSVEIDARGGRLAITLAKQRAASLP
jgi:serine/threonine-protein kinase RsbW